MKITVYVATSVLLMGLVATTVRDLRGRDRDRVSWLTAWVDASRLFWVLFAGFVICYLLMIFVVGF